jgi:hypothetical protein
MRVEAADGVYEDSRRSDAVPFLEPVPTSASYPVGTVAPGRVAHREGGRGSATKQRQPRKPFETACEAVLEVVGLLEIGLE